MRAPFSRLNMYVWKQENDKDILRQPTHAGQISIRVAGFPAKYLMGN